MKLTVVVLICILWEANAFPYPYYGSNFDTLSYGSSDLNRGGMVLSRYYNPYYNPQAMSGGMAAFMYKPEEQYRPPASQYYLPDRRRQTLENTYVPQQNEVYYPQVPDKGVLPEQPGVLPDLPTATEPASDIADPTEKIDLLPTTVKSIGTPELIEPEIEEIPKAIGSGKRRLNKKKQAKRPDEDEEEDQEYPRMPAGTYFPMFFGYGGRSGTPNGATAIANAFSTGRGGVATSHATAYGPPRPEYKEKY